MMNRTVHGIVSGIALTVGAIGEAHAAVTMVDLGTLGGRDSFTYAVHNGPVVGMAQTSDGAPIRTAPGRVR